MPLTRFKSSVIADGAIDTAELADGAVTLVKTDNLFVNTEISGTEAARMPQGTTAQRANVQSGDIRFNTTLSLMEYYDGTEWKAIDTPPTVSSLSPTSFDTAGDTITVTGSNFQSGVTAIVVGADGTEYTPDSVTRVSSTSITFDITAAMVTNNDPFKVKITNASGLNIEYSGLDFQSTPAWVTSSGSLGTYYNYNRTGLSYTVQASTDDSNDTIAYAITSGALPSGLSLNTSTGAITGDAASVGSSTTYTFGITATATTDVNGDTLTSSERTFTLTAGGDVITTYTSVGSGTFSVPTGLTAVDVLVVAGGGSGASYYYGSGAGAGGLIFRPAFPVTPGGSVSYSVGGGGAAIPYTYPSAPQSNGLPGQNSTFGTLTAIGGGGGVRQLGQTNSGLTGQSGGSGGGASSYHGGSHVNPGGTGTQPQQPGDSGTYGFGNPGGGSDYASGGGGGAGGAGSGAPNFRGGNGGVGKQYDISGSQVYYAGGGGGAGDANGSPNQGGTGGQGGGGSATNDQSTPGGPAPLNELQKGVANRGGGGAGGYHNSGVGQGGAGGSGIVIIKY